MLDKYTINPNRSPQLSVIVLHGLGADGSDLVPVANYLNIPKFAIRYVFPTAQIRPITIYSGFPMRAWYDLLKEGWGHKVEDRHGIEQAGKFVFECIQEEIDRGLNPRQIVLAGFSQGGALALFSGLRYPAQLAGIIALSTYLPVADSTAKEKHAANAEIPILYMHGLFDDVIPHSVAITSRENLHKLGYKVEARDYDVGHSVSPQQIVDISSWITRRCEFVESNPEI